MNIIVKKVYNQIMIAKIFMVVNGTTRTKINGTIRTKINETKIRKTCGNKLINGKLSNKKYIRRKRYNN
jgi:hypothetical protein